MKSPSSNLLLPHQVASLPCHAPFLFQSARCGPRSFCLLYHTKPGLIVMPFLATCTEDWAWGWQFLKQLGLHPNWQFVDVYGMEPELLSMVPRPVCAVLLLFPITEKYEVFRTEEEEKIKSQGQDVTSSVYFMKQTISNACGTIGLIHAIANNKDKMHFESGSTLKKFLEESVSMSPEERAKYLENYDAIRVTHETSAHEGQTEMDGNHFQSTTGKLVMRRC
ncbi:ubiquitin carboxyl-terminal hydrolase isozyme L3 isoform X4 [Alexandromys fortis]|uniref:ubiquitin carboxyl-terminal hydrolase isozyme L3 isoform X4 n=1 Tax=Alexandromys fortis TaxID=100897 RepID=UPI0021523F6F|nr:ubiquitin carboxyl-terminal hydrolase isozyme L3 isoform X4 [Microtus fortis]